MNSIMAQILCEINTMFDERYDFLIKEDIKCHNESWLKSRHEELNYTRKNINKIFDKYLVQPRVVTGAKIFDCGTAK